MAALIWNNRDAATDEFAAAYESLLKQDSVDYNKVNHRNISDINFKAFFKDGLYEAAKYPNVQVFDEAGIVRPGILFVLCTGGRYRQWQKI